MQRQRNTIESIPESLQINFGSNSFGSDMDQPFYESNMILNSEETPTLSDYLLSPNDSSLDYLNMPSRGSDGLNIWNARDHNSSGPLANQENHDETKMDYGWNTALSINPSGGPRMAEEGCERTGILSLENVDLNLNNTPVDDVTQSFTLSCQHVDRNACGGPRSAIAEVSMCPFIPEFFEPENVPLSTNASSSGGVGQVLEDNVKSRNSVDGRHLTCKRKNIDVIGESSTSHHTSADLSMSSSSKYLPVASSLEGNQSPDFSPMHRGVSSEWYPSSSFSRNAETSQRNCRVRPNPAPQHDISPSQSHSAASSSRLSSIWSPAEPSSVLNPLILSAEQNQPHIQPVPGLARHVHYSPSSLSGCSSSTVYAQRRLITSPEESNIRNLPRNSNGNHPTFLTRTNADHLVQDPPNWSPSNSSLSMSGNRASSSSCIIPLQGSIRVPSEMVPAQYTRNLSEVVLGTLFPSGGIESGRQSNNVSSRHSVRSASTQEPGQSSRTVRHGQSPPYPRTAVSIDRLRDGVSGLPLSARSRDGRSRMISEHIRNALDLMRRGVNLRFEDVFIFDQSGFYGRADLHDRHRDMRLDVDNMSYEELLALEERIGYVSTGLSEDTILKRLRQWKFSPCKLMVASAEQEPCCICREDYHEGEDIGTLDCRHDFHAECIKQWLMIKNLCPICKTTAVVT